MGRLHRGRRHVPAPEQRQAERELRRGDLRALSLPRAACRVPTKKRGKAATHDQNATQKIDQTGGTADPESWLAVALSYK